AIGDGDHGINMTRGFEAVGKALAGQSPDAAPGRVLVLAGKTLVATVGGASGPLWGSAFRAAGRSLGDAEGFDGEGLAAALDAALAAVVDLGAAAPGRAFPRCGRPRPRAPREKEEGGRARPRHGDAARAPRRGRLSGGGRWG